MQTLYKVLFLVLISASISSATHLLGGEIRATNLSGLTYRISAQIYFDAVGGSTAADAQKSIEICFGDGSTAIANRTSLTALSGESKGISVGVYEVTHTYPSSGLFQVSSALTNRSFGIINYNDDSAPMFLWTVVNTQFSNSTPVLPIPVTTAGAKQVLKIDLKPTISDSDSISAHLQKLSSPSPGTCGVRMLDEKYIFPNDVVKKGTFSLDQVDKKLIWNAPEALGKYIYAVVIDEWRDGIKISETYREGIITVIEKDGPTVESPAYVPATTSGIIAGNPDGDYSELTLAIDAYPVPTQDYLTVKVESKYATTLKIQLLSLEGRIVREINTTYQTVEWKDQLDLRQLTNGLYIIKATDENGKFATKKVVR